MVNYVLWLPYCATVFRSVNRSSFFFFCQHFKDLYLHYVLTDFDKTFFQVSVHHPIYVIGVKGHVGVTGVKNVDFAKNATPPTDYVA